MFKEAIYQWHNADNISYDPQLKYKEIFVIPRVNYMTEVLRQLGSTHRRIVAVVESEHLEYIDNAWLKIPPEMRSLESLIKVNKGWNANVFAQNDIENNLKQETFLEFVEKLAILDVMTDSFINDNFIKHKAFPFSHLGFLGHETAMLNVFTYWSHYREIYAKQLSQVVFEKDSISQYHRDLGVKYEDHIDTETEDEIEDQR